MGIGKILFEQRTAHRLSQEELANILNVSRQSVSKWETDAAVPDLDHLIKLCDTFHLSLDALTGRVSCDETVPTDHSADFSAHQRIIGYILLAVSLIAAVLIALLAKEETTAILSALIAAAVFACSLVCLSVRRHAGYWCAWIAFAPITVLSPFIVSLHIFRFGALVLLIWYGIMGGFAKKQFGGQRIPANRRRAGALLAGWIVTVGVWVWMHLTTVNTLLPFTVVNVLVYAAFARLVTATAAYTARDKTD